MIITKEKLHLFSELFEKEDNKPLFPNINNNIKKYILKKLSDSDYNINFNNLKWHNKNKSLIEFIDSNFYTLNKAKININGTLNKDILAELNGKFEVIYKDLNSEMYIDEEESINFDDNQDKLELIYKSTFNIEKHHTIRNVYQSMFDCEGFCKFQYFKNHEENQLQKSFPININVLQRFEIKINSKIMMYDQLTNLHYECPACGNQFYKSFKELESTNMKTECLNTIINNEGVAKKCKKPLSKPTKISKSVNINVYDAVVLNKRGEPESILVESMEELNPYIYDTVGFRLQDNGEAYLFVIDYKEIKNNIIDVDKFKQDILEYRKEKPDINIIPYWFNFIDTNIFNLSKCKVLGMQDVKFALLFQKLNHLFKNRLDNIDLDNNVAMVGDNQAGKTWTFEHYCYFLYGGRFKTVDGENISTPSLRGSSKSNREITKGNKNIPGLLSLYDNILIDEIDLNSVDIMEALKPTLNKETFGNNKADGDKIERPRTCHVNITENIDKKHLAVIHGMVKKEYESLYNDPTIDKNGDEPEKFSYSWNIFDKLYNYDNLILRLAIKNIRMKFEDDGIHYLDGKQFAVRDRFPFCYVVKKTNSRKLSRERALAAMKKKSQFKKKKNYLAINKKLQQLTVDNINDLFLWLEDYVDIDFPDEVYDKLLTIQEEYDISENIEPRCSTVIMMIMQISRILNLRKNFTEVDFDMVKRYFYMKDRVCYIEEFDDIEFFKDVQLYKNVEDKIDIEEDFKEYT